MPLSKGQLGRIAAILEQIDKLGNELKSIADTEQEYHDPTTVIGGIQWWVIEGLAIDPETHIPPAEWARQVRALMAK